MKKTVLALTLATSLGVAACSDSNEIVVTSTIGDLTQEDFYEEMKKLAGTQFLEQIVIEKVLNDKYEVSKEDVDAEFEEVKAQFGDEFQNALKESGLTEDTLRSNIKFNQLRNKAIADSITDEDIKAYYDQASMELKARHILVKDEETANEVIEKLNAGEDFATLAKELSEDTGSAENGGDLDWFTVGKMVTEFNDAAYALEINEISKPVKSQFGYHIIQVTDKREIEDFGTLEEKKDAIKETLIANAQASSAYWQTVVADLVKEAKIEVKDKDLSGAFSDFK